MAKKKKRIYEVAKDLNISTNDLMRKLKFMGVRADNIFNAVDDDIIDQVKKQMGLHLFEEPEMLPIAEPPMKRRETSSAKPFGTAPAPAPPKPPAAAQPHPPAAHAPAPHAPAAPTAAPAPPKAPAPQPQAQKPVVPPPAKPQTSAPSQPPAPPKQEQPRKPQQQQPQQQRPGQPAQQHRPGQQQQSQKPQQQPRRDDRKDRSQKPPAPELKNGEVAPVADPDIYTSPSKRLEAIRQRGMTPDRKGMKTTFIKKRSKKDKLEAAAAGKQADDMPPVRKRIKVTGPMSVKDISHELGVKSSDIIMFLMKELQLMTSLNQSLDLDIITLIAEHFGCTVFRDAETEEKWDEMMLEDGIQDGTGERITRPPVVTVMGHVDHGKTKLLDAIRDTNVIATEHGGITQHIGAYQIEHKNRPITFLDTPGHAAFTQLRARGAKVTDLAVLVVAADDGVMPQTMEAIDHARDAKVPILVAINKIDKPNANADKVRQQLSDKGLIPEEWGGETVMVEISAKMKLHIDDLLDMIFLITDMMDLKCNPKRKATGTVIEAKLDKGRGPVATVLVQNGTLRNGDYIVAGTTYGRVRAMDDDRGAKLETAPSGAPVEVFGLHEVPQAGDHFFVIEDEKTAKEIASDRLMRSREERLRYESRISLDDLFKRIQHDKLKEFKIVLKGDVQGSIEAIKSSLESIKHQEVRVNVIRAGVGEIKETDIMLAAASNAVVMGYNININAEAQAQANTESVEVRHYEIIYQLIEDVKRAMAGLLAPEYTEVFTGRAEVRKVFPSSRLGNIAGSYVTEGELQSTNIAKLIRKGEQVYKGKISSLKRFKDNVKNVQQGFECGILLTNFDAFEEGDIIEAFKLVEKKHETI